MRSTPTELIVAICFLSFAVTPAPSQGSLTPVDGSKPAVLRALDANGDGTVSAGELAAASSSLGKLDGNGDGELSVEELMGPRRRRRLAAVPQEAPSLEKPPLANDDAEKKILGAIAALEKQRQGNMNVPLGDGRLLRLLTEATNAQHVVEIGTSNGYSGVWICLGLRATGGRLTTYEIDPRRADLALASFAKAGVEDLVTLVLGDAHQEVTHIEKAIDILFLDADKSGYLDYLKKLTPRIRPGGLILAHNMRRPVPDPAFIKAITTDPAFETLFLHMDGAGMAVTLKKRP